jgi:uncharacterized protein
MIPASLLAAATMGLLGGTHCVVMCGGVVGMTCSAAPLTRRRTALGQLPYVLAYNAGRVASYGVAGALAGALTGTVAHFGSVERVQLVLRILAGLTMLAMGLAIAGIAPALGLLERAGRPLWRRVAPLARSLLPLRSPLHAVALGLVWGWMPCGLVYAALALSITAGSPAQSAATMLAFGAGTLPMLLALGSTAAIVVRAARAPRVRRAAGVALIALGLMHVADSGRLWMSASDAASRVCCFLVRGA